MSIEVLAEGQIQEGSADLYQKGEMSRNSHSATQGLILTILDGWFRPCSTEEIVTKLSSLLLDSSSKRLAIVDPTTAALCFQKMVPRLHKSPKNAMLHLVALSLLHSTLIHQQTNQSIKQRNACLLLTQKYPPFYCTAASSSIGDDELQWFGTIATSRTACFAYLFVKVNHRAH
jgi:hypothetical protein